MDINHNLKESPNRNIGMLLPIGDYYNVRVPELKEGDSVEFMDGLNSEVVSVCVISSKSDVAKSLSLQIYGLPINEILEYMKMNWYSDISDEEIIYLVIKKNNESKT